MIEFDAETARILEIAYQGGDFTRRRQANFDAVCPAPADTILDIGCGNGLLSAELARAVGPGGRVIGIDPSPDMLAVARARCAEFDWVDFAEGAAESLPIPDSSADKAVSVQVFEYVGDLDIASAEAYRALRSGGILVVGDIHFDTLAWFSDDVERMGRMISSWDHHLVRRDIPAVLPAQLRAAGFTIEDVRPFTMCDHVLKPDGLAAMMLRLMRSYAITNGHVPDPEAQAWFEEQEQLAKEGRFFFSLTHFVVVARKA